MLRIIVRDATRTTRAQRSIRLPITMLTVTSDRNTLEELEAVGALPRRDLAVGEFRQEFGLLVVNHVFIACRECDLDTANDSGGLDLKRYCCEITVFALGKSAYSLALGLVVGRPESSCRCHFVKD